MVHDCLRVCGTPGTPSHASIPGLSAFFFPHCSSPPVNTWSASVLSGLALGLSGKKPACQGRRCRLNPWVGTIPWRREGLGESHGQRSLVGYSLWGRKELDATGRLSAHAHYTWAAVRQLGG